MTESYCSQCGNQLENKASYCSNCGVEVSSNKAQSSESNWVVANVGWWRNLALVGGIMIILPALFVTYSPADTVDTQAELAGYVWMVSLPLTVSCVYLYRRARRGIQ